MSTIDLLQPLFENGISAPNYFNGRVLSAEDLVQAAVAEQQVDHRLGRAIGDGVVYGLEVVRAPTEEGAATIRIQPGMAINRRGVAMQLSDFQIVRLDLTTPVRGDTPGFGDCGPVPDTRPPGQSGVYLLTIGPAKGNRGLAEVTGLHNVTASCNIREVVEGVQFRLIPMAEIRGEPIPPDRLRNEVAAACLGIEQLLGLKGVAPSTDIASYGAIDDLRQAGWLTECEVPLATIRLAERTIAFIDCWSARRRTVRPASELRWPHLVGDRRLAEAEAFFLQFQSQLLDVAPIGADARGIESPTHFDWLPPAGILPVGARGFAYRTFFKHQSLAPIQVDIAFARQVIQDSFYREPFRSNDPEVELQVLQFRGHPEYVVYCRVERVESATPPQIEPLPGPGGFDIDITWPTGSDPEILDVWAQDETGKRFPAIVDPLIALKVPHIFFRNDSARYRVRGLMPGQYWVKVKSRNFPIASVPAAAIAKTSVLVSVHLRHWQHPCPPKHKVTKPVDKILVDPDHRLVDNAGRFYDGFAVMHDFRTKATAIPKSVVLAPGMQPSNTVKDLIAERWECWLEIDPDALVWTEVLPEFWIDPHFDPNVFPPPSDPYAWMKIDDVAYPLVLLPQERALPTTVPPTRANVEGLGIEEYLTVLEPMGLGDIDVLAGAWGGLYRDALDIPPASIGMVSETIANKTKNILETKQYFAGVTPDIGQKLQQSDNQVLKDDVSIANSTVNEIFSNLMAVAGDDFATEDQARALAVRMQATARDVVPVKAWTVNDDALGLNDALLTSMVDHGIQSKGELAAASEELRHVIAADAGTSLETVNAIASTGSVLVAGYVDAAKPEQSLADLNLTSTQREQLIEAGVTSPTQLATTDLNLTATLGIQEQQAAELVTRATNVATTKWTGLSNAVSDIGTTEITSTLRPAVTGSTIAGGFKIVGGLG